ncbi:MAG TPA: SulP family inorganic anion transporter [Croceibacterium sp.]
MLLGRLIPGLATLKGLSLAGIPRELGAGVSVAAVAIPIGLAYSRLVGLPPEIGLYASIFPTLAYALFGPSSRFLVIGPDTSICLLLGSTVTALGVTGFADRAPVVAGLTLLVGLACLAGSVLKLGFVANLISRPVLVGYLAGVALTLLVKQLSSVTQVPLEAPGLVRPFIELGRHFDQIHWWSVVLALGLLAILRAMKRWTPRIPGPPVVVVGALVLSAALGLEARGFDTIGALPAGLPALALPRFTGDPAELTMAVAGLFVVSFTSGILTARSFGQKVGAPNRPNRELAGFGAANIAAGLFQGFAVTGADSRTAVALSSGGQTALTGIAAAGTVALVVAFLTGPLALLPEAALGAILLSAAIDLFDLHAFKRLARIDRRELWFALVATAGVVWVGVLSGVFVAVILTLAHLVLKVSRPEHRIMGWHPERDTLVSLRSHPDARLSPQITVFLFEGPVMFLNAEYFRQRVLEALEAYPESRWLVLNASSMTHADTSTVDELETLKAVLDTRGIALLIGGGHGDFRVILDRSGLKDLIGRDRVHLNGREALLAAERERDA